MIDFNLHDVLDAHRRRAKRLKPTAIALEMVCGSSYIPKPNPARPRGEDSHFFSDADRAFGVADGVGGWSSRGIDSGVYARKLMLRSAAAARSAAPKIDPLAILRETHASTKARGSSTACVAALDGDSLRVANVGDSGLWVFRSGRCVYVSPVQQSRFNCPYQLSRSRGSPDRAAELTVRVEDGDVVVCGTDGLLDNVYPSEVEKLLESMEENQLRLEAEPMAQLIAEIALDNSRNRSFVSPFEANAEEAGRHGFTGGKVDDITVIVALINSGEDDR